MEHTQGKWNAETDIFDKKGQWIVGNKIRVIATISSAAGLLPPKEVEANARLIATAPELLAACEKAHYVYDFAICRLPTSDLRTKLTDENILRMQAIKAAKQGN